MASDYERRASLAIDAKKVPSYLNLLQAIDER
jgi:hypothetical protein